MNSIEFTNKFFLIEKCLQLFSDQSLGPAWWNAVRYEVYVAVYQRLTGNSVPEKPLLPMSRRVWNRIVRQFLSAKLWLRIRLYSYDVLVFRTPRQICDGHPADVAIDDLVALCPGRKLVIDTHPHYYHRIGGTPNVAQSKFQIIEDLHDALKLRFNACTSRHELETLIGTRLAEFASAEASYLDLFQSTGVGMVIMTQNGIEKAMFSAARKAGVVVVEGQHGLIGHDHPSYSYARDIDYAGVPSFPTYFLTLSSYWQKTCYYPANHCVSIGNDHFFVNPLPPIGPDGDIMMISADIYHAILREWLLELAPILKERRIVYKLHPNQKTDESRIRQEFAPLSNVSVVGGDISARQLLLTTSDVVLIQSTVAHEALQGGRRLHIIPELNYQIHEDLFELPNVVVSDSASALVTALKTPPEDVNIPLFFEPLDKNKALALFLQFDLHKGLQGSIP